MTYASSLTGAEGEANTCFLKQIKRQLTIVRQIANREKEKKEKLTSHQQPH